MTDWLDLETPAVLARVRERTAPAFAGKGGRRKRFEERLAVELPAIFRASYGLFGWRYDFVWVLESIVIAGAEAAAARPSWLRRTPGPAPTQWLSVPSSSDPGSLRRVLAALDVSHVHLRGPAPGRGFAEAIAPVGLVADVALDDMAGADGLISSVRRLTELLDAGARVVGIAGPSPGPEPLDILVHVARLVDPDARLLVDDPGVGLPGLLAVDRRPGEALAAAFAAGSGQPLTSVLVDGAATPATVHPVASASGLALAVILPGIPEIAVADLAELDDLEPEVTRLVALRAGSRPETAPEVITGADPGVVGLLSFGGGREVAAVFNAGTEPASPVVPLDPEEGWESVTGGGPLDDVGPGAYRVLVRQLSAGSGGYVARSR